MPLTQSLDRYARMVVRELHAPTGLVSVVEPGKDRQRFPGAAGLRPDLEAVRETPLTHSFCQYVVRDEAPLIISDARLDPRVAANPAVEEYEIMAYAGYPLVDISGKVVGSVCAIDSVPREWTEADLSALADLAQATSAEVVSRQLHLRLDLMRVALVTLVLVLLMLSLALYAV